MSTENARVAMCLLAQRMVAAHLEPCERLVNDG